MKINVTQSPTNTYPTLNSIPREKRPNTIWSNPGWLYIIFFDASGKATLYKGTSGELLSAAWLYENPWCSKFQSVYGDYKNHSGFTCIGTWSFTP